MKKILTLGLLMFCYVAGAIDLKPFTATYKISRGGKETGQQTTELIRVGDHWQLTDKVVGTRGMASVIGFERTETTQFKFIDSQLVALNHKMRQKAAFSKKKYSFDLDTANNQYKGKHKDKSFTIEDPSAVISSHMMPLAIAIATCRQAESVSFDVLKSKNSKPYHFEITWQNTPVVNRINQANNNRSTTSWPEPEKQCLPAKQEHREKGEPVITTTLETFNWL